MISLLCEIYTNQKAYPGNRVGVRDLEVEAKVKSLGQSSNLAVR